MHKGRISDDGDCLSFRSLSEGFVEAMHGVDGRAHAERHFHSIQRRGRTQCITSDISQHCDFVLRKGEEQTAVRASGAHDRRTDRQSFLKATVRRYSAAQTLRQQILGILPTDRQDVFTVDLKAHGAHLILDDRIQFFYDDQLLAGFR